jgi:hypothetical protein
MNLLLSKTLRPLPLPKVDEDGKVHDAFNDAEITVPYALCRFDGKPTC